MNEHVFQFGTDPSLAAVLTIPAEVDRNRPAVLILNAGIVHRSGPFRLHVDLARNLAKRGYATLRMDLSGLGDSGVRSKLPTNSQEADGLDTSEDSKSHHRAILDATAAMDCLQAEIGASSFVVLGLCSGAYNAHQVALRDQRVVGGVFLDGLAYRTRGFLLRKWFRRATHLRFWRNALKRRLLDGAMDRGSSDGIGSEEFFEPHAPARQVANEIRSLLDRKSQLLFAYTEGYPDINHRRQFKEMFGIRPNAAELQVDYFDNFEHTLCLTAHRKIVVDRVTSWMSDRFPIQSGATAHA